MKSSITSGFDFGVLREFRKREGLSIADVSARSGVSTAVISKLERNQTRAELDTLFRLSRVFGLNTADLLLLAEARTSQQARAETYQSGVFQFESIAYANAKGFHGRASKGATLSRPEIHQDDYEICWVLQGILRLRLPSEIHDLERGDSIQFDAVLEHQYEVLEDCEVIIFHVRKPKRF